jgi:hypothetical protein
VGLDPMQARSGHVPFLGGLRLDGIADASPETVAAGLLDSSHLALRPGAGRLPVNVGWRHPRPVAANDAAIVSGSFSAPGIGAEEQTDRRLPSALTRR